MKVFLFVDPAFFSDGRIFFYDQLSFLNQLPIGKNPFRSKNENCLTENFAAPWVINNNRILK